MDIEQKDNSWWTAPDAEADELSRLAVLPRQSPSVWKGGGVGDLTASDVFIKTDLSKLNLKRRHIRTGPAKKQIT